MNPVRTQARGEDGNHNDSAARKSEFFRHDAHDVAVAERLTPADVDVALIVEPFSVAVPLALEQYGFCAMGEGGPFIASGATRWPDGGLPVNTHGGNLAEAYTHGMTHVNEAVRQIRGTAINQVEGAELALVSGGPAALPVSGLILGKA